MNVEGISVIKMDANMERKQTRPDRHDPCSDHTPLRNKTEDLVDAREPAHERHNDERLTRNPSCLREGRAVSTRHKSITTHSWKGNK